MPDVFDQLDTASTSNGDVFDDIGPKIAPKPNIEPKGYLSEFGDAVKRGASSLYEGAKSLVTPHDTYGATAAQESKLGPVGRALYNPAADLLQGAENATVARNKSKDSGENWAGQALAYGENLPLLGPIVREAEKAGPGYAKMSPATVGAITEGATEAVTPMLLGKAMSKAKSAVKSALTPIENETVLPKHVTKAADDFVKAVPPTKTAPYEPTDYETARPYLETEHTESPIKSVPDLVQSADKAISKIEDKVSGYIKSKPRTLLPTGSVLRDVADSLGSNAKSDFVAQGLKELAPYDLDKPMFMEKADAVRKQLNADNKAVLKRNNYDVETARVTDPGFAARESAAESLRNHVYNGLEENGISGVRQLRQDEGSLIKVRNAGQNHALNGDVEVRVQHGPVKKIGAALTRAAGTGLGAYVAGPVGAIVGAGAGDTAASMFTPSAMTRNELVGRSFSKSVGTPRPSPTVTPQPKTAIPLPAAPDFAQVPAGKVRIPTSVFDAKGNPVTPTVGGPVSGIGPSNPTGFRQLQQQPETGFRGRVELEPIDATPYERGPGMSAREIIERDSKDKTLLRRDRARQMRLRNMQE